MKKIHLIIFLAMAVYFTANAQSNYKEILRETDESFFKTERAKNIGDQLLAFQRVTGGWPKNIDMVKPMNETELRLVLQDKSRQDDSTTDNDATNMQMLYLARLYKATKIDKYREAFCKGVEYLLSGQYDNGGWPQFWPQKVGYQYHITFNDNAMVNTMLMLRDIYLMNTPFDKTLTNKQLRNRSKVAFAKGVECILKCQIVTNGKSTVWCQQHDHVTLEPAPARSYELRSYCSAESAGIVRLLMEIPNPTEAIKKAIRGAMIWFDKYKLTGVRIERTGEPGSPNRNTFLVKDATSTALWARFYDLENCEPFVCDRDGIPRKNLSEIGLERRNGYSWYNNQPAELYPLYQKWAEKYDKENILNISLQPR